jgi:hypothetical protein
LPVNVSRRHDPHAVAAGSGRDHPGVPPVAEAREAQGDAEAEAEAQAGAEAQRDAEAGAEAQADAEAQAEAEAQVAFEAPAESEPPVTKSRRRPTGARSPRAGGGRTSETM